MAPPTVQLVVDLYDGSSAPACGVTAEFTPSAPAGDVPDSPVRVALSRPGGYQSAVLVPTDSGGARNAGWAYYAEFTGIPGLPSPFWFTVPAGPAAFTCTSAAPGVFTWTATAALTSLPNGTGVQLSGTVPAGLLSGVTYYVTGASGSTFSLAGAPGGPALATTSTGSGNLSVTRYNLSALAAAQQPGSPAALAPAVAATALTVGAATPLAGYALANSTATIASWTAPNDGKLHRVLAMVNYQCTSTCTGGSVAANVSALPNGNAHAWGLLGGGYAVGFGQFITPLYLAPGAAVSLQQTTALTAGAATVWADLIAL